MNRAVVGLGSCGLAAGGRGVFQALERELSARHLEVELDFTGCLGLCHREVLVELESDEAGSCLYGNVTVDAVPGLLADHFESGRIHDDLVVWRFEDGQQPDLLAGQRRIALRNCGRINPESLDEFVRAGGYGAFERTIETSSPDEVIEAVQSSGLRGRGGAGFSTGNKWQLARGTSSEIKYVICNADEGDPGAFMDRNILESDPFSVLEGMAIAAFAIGANHGYVYVRDEYPLAVARLERAIGQAREGGYLGQNIRGSGFDFDIELRRGAGAFVCGEETALIASLEGRRGVPRRRPPFPVERGLWDRPTVINNVETLANVPWILARGASAFRSIGIGDSAGTKVFSLAGDVRNGGMIEVPMGTTIRQVIEEIGGGSKTNRGIKAVQIGGPSGGCIPASLFDTPIDYESLMQTGAIMGSGGLVAMDESRCMVEVARFFLSFAQEESCGKCTFCRVGTKRMLEMMERICAGEGADLARLEELGSQVQRYSECGLGKTAPNAVLTTLRYFRSEYEAHIDHRRCPAGECSELISFEIDAYKCDGCSLCLDQCTPGAISKQPNIIPLSIDMESCTRCRGCYDVCEFEAVVIR